MSTGSAGDVDFEKVDFDSLLNMKNYITKGAFGAVHGPIKWNSKEVAVKVILSGEDRLDEFKRKVEAKKSIWTSLKHKNLIEILYVSLREKVVYIVMEYASGGSLRQLLDNSDTRVYRQINVTNCARQLAEGMLFLHDRNIVHRDLKSSNIVLMDPFQSLNDHEEITLKITDFDEVQENLGTATMSFRGTCSHMAPEVLTKEWFSKASDVWSYGVVLWEMLTRDLPHNGLSVGPLVEKATSGQLALPTTPESIPTVFKQLLCDCWSRDTQSRPPFKTIIDQLISIDSSEETLRYKSDPVFVQTIRTKAFEEAKKGIGGLAILGKELFVVIEKSSEVEVYDSVELSFSRRWKLNELFFPGDIVSCNRKKCLYISDYKGPGKAKEILRVDPNGIVISKWSTGNDWGWGLSVTAQSNIILTAYQTNRINEYSPDGQLKCAINLQSDSGISNPWRAIKLTNGHFMVSHGSTENDLHGVCIVDADGKHLKAFGGKCGSTIGQMNQPVYLSVDGNVFVMVIDRENGRVLLLNSNLEFKREILSKEGKHRLQNPWKILLDKSNGRMLVADNELNNQRILIFNID